KLWDLLHVFEVRTSERFRQRQRYGSSKDVRVRSRSTILTPSSQFQIQSLFHFQIHFQLTRSTFVITVPFLTTTTMITKRLKERWMIRAREKPFIFQRACITFQISDTPERGLFAVIGII